MTLPYKNWIQTDNMEADIYTCSQDYRSLQQTPNSNAVAPISAGGDEESPQCRHCDIWDVKGVITSVVLAFQWCLILKYKYVL